MVKHSSVVALVFVILFGLFSSTTATPIAKIVTGVVSNAVSAILKWLWPLKSTTKPSNQFSVKHSRSMMKFESGYTVETIFDGSKLGIEPYSVEISSNGEFLVLDSENSNIYKFPTPVSTYGKPKIFAGSPEGYSGHIDGRPREARMNHPKGLAVDDRGNVYIADTMNMAIRKISDEGVTTIAGGRRGQLGGHVDGAGEDAKFSNDFDVVYAASSCSLLVVDRGNLAIREIHLHHQDCNTYRKQHQDEDDEDDDVISFPLGIAVLVAAGFFGYMLALLHWRVKAMFSSPDDPRACSNIRKGMAVAAAQQRPPKSVRPPLIPNEEEYEKGDEEGFFGSIGRLFMYSGSAFVEIFGSLFRGSSKSKKKTLHYQYQQQMNRHPDTWPVQESFVIPDEDEPPPCLETRTSNPRETYPYMNQKDLQKPHQQHLNQPRGAYLSNNGWDDDEYNQQIQHQRKQQLLHKHYSSSPHQSYYDQNCEANEIVFGAVQELDGRRETMVIKAVDYGDPKYNHRNLRPRLNYVGYSHGY